MHHAEITGMKPAAFKCFFRRIRVFQIAFHDDIALHEDHDAATIIREAVHEDAHIIFGAVTDEKLEDELRVTVIATGFHHRDADARTLRPTGRGGPDAHGLDGVQERRQRSQGLNKEVAPPADAGGRRLDIPAFVRRKIR